MLTFTEKLDTLIQLITDHTQVYLKNEKLDCPVNLTNGTARIFSQGPRFVSIALGNGVRYFVDKTTETVYASASYKKANMKRSFGTLDTINDFFWGGYEARPLNGTMWAMKKTGLGYVTMIPSTTPYQG